MAGMVRLVGVEGTKAVLGELPGGPPQDISAGDSPGNGLGQPDAFPFFALGLKIRLAEQRYVQ
jgi:hypothetical protein